MEGQSKVLDAGTDALGSLQQLLSRIDSKTRAQEVIDRAKDLDPEERQLLVDILSETLNRKGALTYNHPHAWFSLIKIASSANVFARNRTLNPEKIISSNETPSEYQLGQGGTSRRLKVLRHCKEDATGRYSEELVGWVHLSHPNILPLYAAFLEDGNHPYLVSPYATQINICNHSKELSEEGRLRLISDIVNGLHYIHQSNTIHGGLNPETVTVSSDGRALITNLDRSSETRESDSLPVRYSAPELLEEDDSRPTKATDIWSFACLGYEVLSGTVPFCQFLKDSRVLAAVVKGSKPLRPGQGGIGGNKIIDAMWNLLLVCWENDAEERPDCATVQQALLGIDIMAYSRPEPELSIGFDDLRSSTIDHHHAKDILTRTLGSDQPTTTDIPKHLRNTASDLVDVPNKSSKTTAAAKKLSPDDTQTMLLKVVKNNSYLLHQNPTMMLLRDLTTATHIFPQCYRIDGVQYDPSSLVAESVFMKRYKGHQSNVRITVLKDSASVTQLASMMAQWENSPHPNILPFHGIFHENINESPRICFVLPYLKNGNLHDYVPTLSRDSRMLLLSDVIDALVFIHNSLNMFSGVLYGHKVLISDEGRAILVSFNAHRIFSDAWKTNDAYFAHVWRFQAPETRAQSTKKCDIWSFGCLTYEVFTGKLPYYQYPDDHPVVRKNAETELDRDDVRPIVDFLDQALKDHLSISEERNRVLAVLSRITSTTHVFPQRYELKNVRYNPQPIAEGGFGNVYQGVDTTLCIKVMKRLDPGVLTPWIKELILWAHSSHPNVLLFYGVFLEGPIESPQTCLVSPFMKNGNLHDYSPNLPQKSRLPLIADVVNGLHYLHDLGVVHGDLKGQNILISDEGRGLITDFGSSHITTATIVSSSLSATTLRFAAPEMILGNKKPSKEFDIWSVGCLCYAVLSRKLPYHECKMEVQIIAALSRKEPPTRPGTVTDNAEEVDDWDHDFDAHDWDFIDDQAWNLIIKCCAPEPQDRPTIAVIQELVVDLKIWDDRPAAKALPDTEILKLRSQPKINLNRVEELLDQVQSKIKTRAEIDPSTD
ncbi:Cytokinesis protein sepH [Leucoagaricus sp. SymC.cos]|nr:Cytokinesis protein sepH [Leucoagaricus sp. SymC.cos]